MTEKIGFIGLGVMGHSMVSNLLAVGYYVTVNTRTKEKAMPAITAGAVWAESAQVVTAQSDVIITMLGFPTDVQTVYQGEDGIFSTDIKGKVLIDMSTSTPTLAIELAKIGASMQAAVLDAPVSGGDIGAQKGTLSIMVGGEEATYRQILPIFKVLGQEVVYFGPAGSGQHAKMVNQIMVAGTMTGLTEMLVYAKAAGLDEAAILKTIGQGAAGNWSLANYGPRIIKNDFAPGFYVKHFLKDLRIVLDEAKKMNLDLPATKQAEALYANLVALGYGDAGTQALIKLYEQ